MTEQNEQPTIEDLENQITTEPAKTFGPEEIQLLRKATWMATVKYDELRIQAQAGQGRGSMGANAKYWEQKAQEMKDVYEKLADGSTAPLTLYNPPF